MTDPTAGDLGAIDEHAFVVIRDLLSPPILDSIRTTLRPHLAAESCVRNDFEGYRPQRV